MSVSVCNSSRPDLVAYHIKLSMIVVLYNISENVQQRVKALPGIACMGKQVDSKPPPGITDGLTQIDGADHSLCQWKTVLRREKRRQNMARLEKDRRQQ